MNSLINPSKRKNFFLFLISLPFISTVSFAQPNLTVSASENEICEGSSTVLTATLEGDIEVFTWGNDPTIGTPNSLVTSVTPTENTTYTATAIYLGANLIQNGDFEMGDVSFTTDYDFGPESAPINTENPLWNEGTYMVLDDPSAGHFAFGACLDHTTGIGNMLVVNGSSQPNEKVWCQTIETTPESDYFFSTWITSVEFGNPAQLEFSINDALLGVPIQAPPTTCGWLQFFSTWNSGANTSVEICISNQNFAAGGNDFALDDIYFSTFESQSTSIDIQVSNIQGLIEADLGLCEGTCTNEATLSAIGGIIADDYQYIWSDGQTTATATNLCAGEYEVTVTDDIGCTFKTSILLEEEAFEVFAFQIEPSPCSVSSTGSASVSMTGGLPPFSTTWDNGEIGMQAQQLSEGFHSVTVSDDNGCSAISNVEITLFEGLIPSEVSANKDTICIGETTEITVTGGNTSTYLWNTNQTSSTISVSPEVTTTYSVETYTTGNNLVANGGFENGNVGFSSQYSLTDDCPGCYEIAPTPTNTEWAQCTDHTSGSGNMMIFQTATAPNTAAWCQSISVVPNTLYDFSFWGQALNINPGNTPSLSFTINEEVISSDFLLSNQECTWTELGSSWNSGSSTNATICIYNNTISGGSTFAIDDILFQAFCPSLAEYTIYVSDFEAAIVSSTDIGCTNTLATAEVSGNNGYTPYTVLWDDGNENFINSELTLGLHSLTITDAVGCTVVEEVQIEEASEPIIETIEVSETSCDENNEATSASISIAVVSGTAPYQYSIDDGENYQTNSTFSALAVGNYEIMVEDALGCFVFAEATVSNPIYPEIEIIAFPDTSFCEENNIELSISSNDAIVWSTGQTEASITIDVANTISATVTNNSNCSATNAITLVECGDFQTPNVFTPNGDTVNDSFGIVPQGQAVQRNLKIFNRWGELVYDGSENWDGNYKGSPSSADVYTYMVEVKIGNKTSVEKGDVTLVR